MSQRFKVQQPVGRTLAGSRISLGVLLLPGPAVSADVFESALGAPAQALSGLAGIGDADGCIARPTVGACIRDGTIACGFHGLHNL